MADPLCCAAPMVHNSFLQQWECADAYFELLDDDVIASTGFGPYALRVERVDQLAARHRERYEHWIASVRLDEPAGDTPQAVDHGD
jgi:hypothetical protein